MRLEARKYIYDIDQAAELLISFVSGKLQSDYLADQMLQSAVERQFEIIGEAIGQLAKVDVAVAERFSGFRQIIAFRNILIHGYAEIDDQLVWDIVETRLPELRRDIANLKNL